MPLHGTKVRIGELKNGLTPSIRAKQSSNSEKLELQKKLCIGGTALQFI